MMSSWQVATAAEAIAAAQFARFGCQVSIQYGANQPEYDLMIDSNGRMLKISVKGSQDGAWGLTQSWLKNKDYHGAADTWLRRNKPQTAICLVQFKGVDDDQLPRVYLAWPTEILTMLKSARGNKGNTILYEKHKWGPRAAGAGTTEQIPDEWKFTRLRLKTLLSANANS